MRRIATVSLVLASTAAVLALGCEEKKNESAATTAAAMPTPAPTPTPAPKPEPEPAKPTRPEKIETEVTPERRAKAEAAVPDAKGFVVQSEIEEKLKGNKKNDKPEVSIPAFDKMAAGKWVLFAGPIANLTATGFDLGVTYTPQMPNDPMGMSRQWFPVTFSDVKGYEESKFKPGQMVVVLAKYAGKQKAGPGQELVEVGGW
jgi:hypothetical protein